MAVKTLPNNASEQDKFDLLHELSIMKMLDPHPNIVRLIGCCTEKGAEKETSVKMLLFIDAAYFFY